MDTFSTNWIALQQSDRWMVIECWTWKAQILTGSQREVLKSHMSKKKRPWFLFFFFFFIICFFTLSSPFLFNRPLLALNCHISVSIFFSDSPSPLLSLQEIVAMVAAELAQQSSLGVVAQSVVDRVKRLHHDVYVSGRQRATYCSRHEDMTLLIRTLNYPLADGALTPTQGTVSIWYTRRTPTDLHTDSTYVLFI